MELFANREEGDLGHGLFYERLAGLHRSEPLIARFGLDGPSARVILGRQRGSAGFGDIEEHADRRG